MRNKFSALEIGILAVVSLVFMNSLYRLMTNDRFPGGPKLQAVSTSPSAKGHGTPSAHAAEARAPAEEAPAQPSAAEGDFAVYETKCNAVGESYATKASKLRILGPLCGQPPARKPAAAGDQELRIESMLADAKIENRRNRYSATVFGDHGTGDFSTDFIPLEPGQNNIHMFFQYRTGQTHAFDLMVIHD